MVDIGINAWSTLFLNLEIKNACSPLVYNLKINLAIGIKDNPFLSFQLCIRKRNILGLDPDPYFQVEQGSKCNESQVRK